MFWKRFELENVDRGHGACFPDNQPQLLTYRVSAGLGPSPFWEPAPASSKGVLFALREGERPLVGGWRWGETETWTMAL